MDNTLYDWLGFFAPAIRGLACRVSELSGVPASQIFDELRAVFTEFGNVEYSFPLQHLPSLQHLHPHESGPELAERYWAAVRIYQHRRRSFLRLYPGVRSGLTVLNELGIRCVAVTDALSFQAKLRLKQLKILDLLDIAAQPRHEEPAQSELDQIRKYPADLYEPVPRAEYQIPAGLRKPSPGILQFLMSELHVEPSECVLVGDNLVKDIGMAQAVGILDCWAAYGCRQSASDFATLARVTHWDKAAVAAAANPTPQALGVTPTVTAHSFEDVIDVVLDSYRWRSAPSRFDLLQRRNQPELSSVGAAGGGD